MSENKEILNDQNIKTDRMRYTKNTFSANLILLAIVFDCLYFVTLYKQDVGSYYYTWKIGVSIVYNLIFLLAAFLASEEVKGRTQGKGPLVILVVIGVIQFIRIFLMPVPAHNALVNVSGVDVTALSDGKFFWMVACLVISGVCLLWAAVSSYKQNKELADYLGSMEGKA